jgi:hypothetical protein
VVDEARQVRQLVVRKQQLDGLDPLEQRRGGTGARQQAWALRTRGYDVVSRHPEFEDVLAENVAELAPGARRARIERMSTGSMIRNGAGGADPWHIVDVETLDVDMVALVIRQVEVESRPTRSLRLLLFRRFDVAAHPAPLQFFLHLSLVLQGRCFDVLRVLPVCDPMNSGVRPMSDDRYRVGCFIPATVSRRRSGRRARDRAGGTSRSGVRGASIVEF